MTPLAAALLGTLLGCAAGLVPGLHANALVTLLAAASLGDAVLLVAVAGSHALVATLPSTYLGVPAEAGHLGVLPAHRLLLEGRGREALRIALSATLAGTLLAVLLLLLFKWLWAEPGRAGEALGAVVPWLLAAVPAWLAWGERRKGLRAVAWGLCAFVLAGLLGLAAARLDGLGALLSGLFGGAGLLSSALGGRPLPTQAPPRWRGRTAGAVATGVLASAATALVPGATPALVASVTPPKRHPEVAVASLAAVGAAQPVFALALLWLTGQARSGLAIGIAATAQVQAWTIGRAPTLLLALLATWLAAGVAGYAVACALDAPVARWLPKLPQVPLNLAAFALLGLLSLLAGWPGLLLFTAGTITGLLPIAAGVRRVHLTGALVLPLLAG